MIFDKYPYTNFHEMNDDWIIQTMKLFAERLDEFVAMNALTYADPIVYNPDAIYPANTVVIYENAAYVSMRATPAGLLPTTLGDYWLMIFPFGDLIQEGVDAGIAQIDAYIAQADEQITAALNAIPLNVNDWLNQHPEVTTTVEDRSLTYAKLHNSLCDILLAEYSAGEMQAMANSAFGQGSINPTTGAKITGTANSCLSNSYLLGHDEIIVLRAPVDFVIAVYDYNDDATVYNGVTLAAVNENWSAFYAKDGHSYRFTVMAADQSAITPGSLPAVVVYYQPYTSTSATQDMLDQFADVVIAALNGMTKLLDGKVVSILGDSISTYTGWIPVADGHNLTHRARYPENTPFWSGTVNDTYWKKIIDTLGAKLGINDSWAGSKVSNSSATNTGDVGPDACMAGITRITNLGANGDPDVIIYYGGTNDAGTGVTIGTFDSTTTYTIDLTTNIWNDFATAYKDSIMRLQYYYPNAKIIVLLPTYTTNYYTMGNLDRYNEIIKEICDYFGVDYIDMRRCGINWKNNATTLGDGVHPTIDGFNMMQNYIVAKLSALCKLDPGENVVYTVTNSLTGNTNADRYIHGVSSGKPYVATITGSALDNVYVSMGGVNVTASVYNPVTGVINIPAVTGDIVITDAQTITWYTNILSLTSFNNPFNVNGYGWAQWTDVNGLTGNPVNYIKIKTDSTSGTLQIGVVDGLNASTVHDVQTASFSSNDNGYAYVELATPITLAAGQKLVVFPNNAPNFNCYYGTGNTTHYFYSRIPTARDSGTAWSKAANAMLGFDYGYITHAEQP